MKAHIAAPPLLLVLCCMLGSAQTTQNTSPATRRPKDVQPSAVLSREHKNNSGPLAWVSSDTNPSTVFWIQGRFVPIDDPNYQGDAQVVTILCSFREHECFDIESTSPVVRGELVWIEDFKSVNWDNNGILATTRSVDGCTDETLKIRFSPPSVVEINSPVLPISENCKKINDSWDKVVSKGRSTILTQMEQDELVPTRGLSPFQDWVPDTGKASTTVPQKNP